MFFKLMKTGTYDVGTFQDSVASVFLVFLPRHVASIFLCTGKKKRKTLATKSWNVPSSNNVSTDMHVYIEGINRCLTNENIN